MNASLTAQRQHPAGRALHLGCRADSPLTAKRRAFLRDLGALLNAPFQILPAQDGESPFAETGKAAESEAEGIDLLVYWEPERSWWRRWLGSTPAVGVADRSAASVLVVRNPRWPVQRILVILRDHESDDTVLSWAGRFAQSNRTEIFILPIGPGIPALYRHSSLPLRSEMQLASLMISTRQLDRLSELFASWGVHGTLLLHDGSPQQRIDWAAAACDCDLIVIGAEDLPLIERRLFGELERPLIRRADRPLLIAREPHWGPG